MFQRVGATALKKDLTNILRLVEGMGHPESTYPSLHIAGTNGKGSVSNLVASALQEAGFKVGLYTSPHLKHFTERIRVNGQMMPEEEVIDFVEKYRGVIEEVKPSFFEVTVAMAFDFFRTSNVNIAVVEVGMGGRLDSTNILDPVAGLVTNISLDHIGQLGATRTLIAGEKAGIFKEKMPVLIGERHPETDAVFAAKAKEMNAPLYWAQDDAGVVQHQEFLDRQEVELMWKGESLGKVELPLGGAYQLRNVDTALAFLKILQERHWKVEDKHILTGFGNVRKNTGFRGRMTVLQNSPTVLVDVGHNEAGIQFMLDHLAKFQFAQLHFVWGMAKDKEIIKILGMLPKDASYYFVRPDVPRGLDSEELARSATESGLTGKSWGSVNNGLDAALAVANPQDLVFVGGSTFVVAEVV